MTGDLEARSARIARAVAWAAEPGPRPDADDVRLAAALGLSPDGPMLQYLWRQPDSLRTCWDDLQRLLDGRPSGSGAFLTDDVFVPVAYPTATPGVMTYPAIVPAATPAPPTAATQQPDAAAATPGAAALSTPAASHASAGERLNRLRAWVEHTIDSRPELAAIGDVDLQRLAVSEASSPDQVTQFGMRTATRSLFATLAGDISAALVGREGPDAGVGQEPPGRWPPEPEPVAPTATRQPAAEAAAWMVSPGHFAPFDWGLVTQARPVVPTLAASPTEAGTHLAWPASDAPCSLYRVVESTETWSDISPDAGALVGVTRQNEASADLATSGAVTFLTVWVNEGENEHAARSSQPRLLAKGEVVWPPRRFGLNVTPAHEVVARFDTPPGGSVEVQRFVAGDVIRYDQSKALWEEVTPQGFVDRQAPPGVELTYAVYSVAVLPTGELLVSAPELRTARVVPDPLSVPLRLEPGYSRPGSYDISWVAPSFGTVEVYLTDRQPPPGLDAETRAIEVLEDQGGLTEARRLNYPVSRAGEECRMTGVTLDQSWVKGYFVAVHQVSSDAARLGPGASQVNVRPPRNPHLVERVDTEIVTFEWPKGVKLVEVFQGPRGEPTLDPERSIVIDTVTEEQYRQRGGLRLEKPLPSNGCALYLYGVVYEGGAPTRSDPARVEYEGIARLAYRVQPMRRDGRPVGLDSPPEFYRVSIRTEEAMPPVPLCLVAHPERLPLHTGDGRLLQQWPAVSPAPGIADVLHDIPAGHHLAHIRLFANGTPEQWNAVAILDPVVSSLRVRAQ